MKWLICGTIPDENYPLEYDTWHIEKTQNTLFLKNTKGKALNVYRGTNALIASTLTALNSLQCHSKTELKSLLVGDIGSGNGSKKLYEHLTHLLKEEHFDGITFHYLFPDVDWHNKVLIACEEQKNIFGKIPFLVADAGFMYVAKMSGYADMYDIFTPDIGEMAFLADEHAPHPFYTRGFLLAEEHNIPTLLEHANAHKNTARNLIIKSSTDYLVMNGNIVDTINTPSVPAMEAIGGTGDLVTGLLTAHLIHGDDTLTAMKNATQKARLLAEKAKPNPATQIGDLLLFF